VPNVKWKPPDDGQRNCPKHVEFLDKNKFGKLVRLLVLLKRDHLEDTHRTQFCTSPSVIVPVQREYFRYSLNAKTTFFSSLRGALCSKRRLYGKCKTAIHNLNVDRAVCL